MKEIIAKQKELIKEWENLSIMNSCQRYIKGLERIDKLKSELTSLEAEQGIDLPPVEQSSQGEGMMSAKDYCCEWHDKKYGGCKEIGDWSPDDVMEFAEEYAAKKMLNILPKQNIPKECTLCKYHPTNNRW